MAVLVDLPPIGRTKEGIERHLPTVRQVSVLRENSVNSYAKRKIDDDLQRPCLGYRFDRGPRKLRSEGIEKHEAAVMFPINSAGQLLLYLGVSVALMTSIFAVSA